MYLYRTEGRRDGGGREGGREFPGKPGNVSLSDGGTEGWRRDGGMEEGGGSIQRNRANIMLDISLAVGCTGTAMYALYSATR